MSLETLLNADFNPLSTSRPQHFRTVSGREGAGISQLWAAQSRKPRHHNRNKHVSSMSILFCFECCRYHYMNMNIHMIIYDICGQVPFASFCDLVAYASCFHLPRLGENWCRTLDALNPQIALRRLDGHAACR